MAPPNPFGARRRLKGGMVRALGGGLGLGRKRGGIADGVRQCQQVVRPGLLGGGGHRQTQDFPAARDGQRVSMLLTEVVAVRFRVGGQRTQDRGGVCIYVRQGGHRRLAAGGP